MPAERVMVGLEAGHGRVGAEGILLLVLGREEELLAEMRMLRPRARHLWGATRVGKASLGLALDLEQRLKGQPEMR